MSSECYWYCQGVSLSVLNLGFDISSSIIDSFFFVFFVVVVVFVLLSKQVVRLIEM